MLIDASTLAYSLIFMLLNSCDIMEKGGRRRERGGRRKVEREGKWKRALVTTTDARLRPWTTDAGVRSG